jgi:Fe-S cluster assembly ATP-binding protein
MGLDPQEYLNRAIDKTLSGGERKRIEMASLLAMKPKLVILDEPDSGIDVEALNHIFEAISILKNNGSTVILITHSNAVLNHAEHAFLMCNGVILDKGSADKVINYFHSKCMPCSHKNMPAEEEEISKP